MKISFKGQPNNFHIIDRNVMRSAQPAFEDFSWIKEQGVTDVINFRTFLNLEKKFDENQIVSSLGMKYHPIPSITSKPALENVKKFLGIIDTVKAKNGKVLFHCFHGSDRTGMYAFIYRMKNGIGTLAENIADIRSKGYNEAKYPHLINWAKECLKQL